MVLDILHVEQDKQQLQSDVMACNGNQGYHIVDSSEKGRVMCTHGKDTGEFYLDIEFINEIFIRFHCDALVCCFPARQYKHHPERSRQLNIQYPDIDTYIFYSTRISHILILGECTDGWRDDLDKVEGGIWNDL